MSSTAERIATLEGRLSTEREKLTQLTDRADAAHQRSAAATPGGLGGRLDHGVLTRPRASERSTARRHAAYDSEAAAFKAAREQEGTVESLARQLERAKADAAAPCDLASLKPGSFVRDRWGWHKVVQVSKKSVSVETGYSWTDRIALEKIIETRDGEAS